MFSFWEGTKYISLYHRKHERKKNDERDQEKSLKACMFTFGCYHFSWFHTCWRWWLWWLIVLCVNAFDISVHLMLTTAIRNTPATITTTRCTQEIFQPKFLSLFFAVVSLFFFFVNVSSSSMSVCVVAFICAMFFVFVISIRLFSHFGVHS